MSNSVRCWRGHVSIRTISEIPVQFALDIYKEYKYQLIGERVRALRGQGLSCREIGRRLGVDGKTVKKAT